MSTNIFKQQFKMLIKLIKIIWKKHSPVVQKKFDYMLMLARLAQVLVNDDLSWKIPNVFLKKWLTAEEPKFLNIG